MRVSMSAIGSVTLILLPLWRLHMHLPAGFGYTGQKPTMGVFAETDAAHGKASNVRLRPSANATAIVLTRRILRRPLRLFDESLLRQCASPTSLRRAGP